MILKEYNSQSEKTGKISTWGKTQEKEKGSRTKTVKSTQARCIWLHKRSRKRSSARRAPQECACLSFNIRNKLL